MLLEIAIKKKKRDTTTEVNRKAKSARVQSPSVDSQYEYNEVPSGIQKYFLTH